MVTTKKIGGMNAARVLAALGRIGYHPISAVLDIVDNSVSASAAKIVIKMSLIQGTSDGPGRRRTLIDSFSIIDNGQGMDEDGINNALSLGSSEEYYCAGTLSKFGLGLKSASSSLGKRLLICSRQEGKAALTAILDQNKLTDNYEYDLSSSTKEEIQILDSHCGKGKSGTIIKIEDIHHESMPKAIEIIEGIKDKAGIIFYYHLKGTEPVSKKIDLSINYDGNDERIEPLDPLFCNEIGKKNGDLDERNWDGMSVKWIQHPQKFQLDPKGTASAVVEITQLPHPPSVNTFGDMSQAECRQKYNIGAGNYGFYIYRNGRLISWADSLNGQIPQDQDLYSFRGRILIEGDADDVLNLDVTKSRIYLSEIAHDQLTPIVSEAKKKSRSSWQNAKKTIAQKTSSDPHAEINAELDKFGDLDEKGQILDEETAPEKERKKMKERRKKIAKESPIKPEESEKLVKQGQRVQYVDELDNNQLWERALDAKEGLIVRVNKAHRLYRDIISIHSENSDLIKILDIFFFSLAKGEYDTLYSGEFETDLVEKVIGEYRIKVGGQFAEILRKLNKP